ncbi:MAG: GIY-YIG nuclease family protein [Nevskiales bacterium]
MADSWYVYILECEDGSLYTGVTKDPKRRLTEHQAGGCRYTRARRGVRMLRARRSMTRVRAYQYEWKLKRATRQQKLAWCDKNWEPV